MTRDEFIDQVFSWYELKDFCNEYECDELDDVYDQDTMSEDIEWELSEYRDEYSWVELRNILDVIPTGYDFYKKDAVLDWHGLDDDDFEGYKEGVLLWGDDNGVWDEDEEDEESFDEYDDTSDEPYADEDFSVDDLMGMCSVTLIAIQKDDMRRTREEDEAFVNLINVNIPRVIK